VAGVRAAQFVVRALPAVPAATVRPALFAFAVGRTNVSHVGQFRDHIDQGYINRRYINRRYINRRHINRRYINRRYINRGHVDWRHIDRRHIDRRHISRGHINQGRVRRIHFVRRHIGRLHFIRNRIGRRHLLGPHVVRSQINRGRADVRRICEFRIDASGKVGDVFRDLRSDMLVRSLFPISRLPTGRYYQQDSKSRGKQPHVSHFPLFFFFAESILKLRSSAQARRLRIYTRGR